MTALQVAYAVVGWRCLVAARPAAARGPGVLPLLARAGALVGRWSPLDRQEVRRLHLLRGRVPVASWVGRAGIPADLAADAVTGLLAIAVAAGSALALALGTMRGSLSLALASMSMVLLAAGASPLLLRRSLSISERCLGTALPQAVHALADARAAGLGSVAALESAARAASWPAGDLLARAARRARTGLAAAEALDLEGRRAASQELVAVAAVLRRADSAGLPAAPALRSLADELIARQRAAITRRAGRAAPRASLVTALVIAPGSVAILGTGLIGGALARGSRLLGF